MPSHEAIVAGNTPIIDPPAVLIALEGIGSRMSVESTPAITANVPAGDHWASSPSRS